MPLLLVVAEQGLSVMLKTKTTVEPKGNHQLSTESHALVEERHGTEALPLTSTTPIALLEQMERVAHRTDPGLLVVQVLRQPGHQEYLGQFMQAILVAMVVGVVRITPAVGAREREEMELPHQITTVRVMAVLV